MTTASTLTKLYATYGARFSQLSYGQKLELVSLCAHRVNRQDDVGPIPLLPIELTAEIFKADDSNLLVRIMRIAADEIDEALIAA